MKFPLDQFAASIEEVHLIEYERDRRMLACMKSRGQAFLLVDRRKDPEQESRRYGVWTMRIARVRGYALPANSAGTDLLELENSRAHSLMERREFTYCAAKIVVKDLVYSDTRSQIAAAAIHGQVLASGDGRSIVHEWLACVQESYPKVRLTEDGSPIPADVSLEITKDTLELAQADVQCKIETNLVRRLGMIESREQLKYIAKNPELLKKQRAQVDAAVSAARQASAARS